MGLLKKAMKKIQPVDDVTPEEIAERIRSNFKVKKVKVKKLHPLARIFRPNARKIVAIRSALNGVDVLQWRDAYYVQECTPSYVLCWLEFIPYFGDIVVGTIAGAKRDRFVRSVYDFLHKELEE